MIMSRFDQGGYYLDVSADTTPEFPTRCTDCNRPVQKLSIFPKGRCIACHDKATANDPLPTAAELARMWGARS